MDVLYSEIPFSSKGKKIQYRREIASLSRRKLASIIGISTRELVAAENDERKPKPCKEQPRHSMVFIPFLGYKVPKFERLPVTQLDFDLESMQNRILRYI